MAKFYVKSGTLEVIISCKDALDFVQANRYAIDKTKERLFPAH